MHINCTVTVHKINFLYTSLVECNSKYSGQVLQKGGYQYLDVAVSQATIGLARGEIQM